MSNSKIHERWKRNGEEEEPREKLLSKGIVGTSCLRTREKYGEIMYTK